MTFLEVLTQTKDYGLTEKIFIDLQGEFFGKNWSFEQWLKVVDHSCKQGPSGQYYSKELARRELVPRAKTYKQLRTTLPKTEYLRFSSDDEGKQRAAEILNQLFLIISDFEDLVDFWDFVHQGLISDRWSERFDLAILEKAPKVAHTFSDWKWILSKSWGHPKQLILEKMAENARTFDDWVELYRVSGDHEETQRNAFQKLVELSKNGKK